MAEAHNPPSWHRRKYPVPTQKRVRELFHYQPNTGLLWRKNSVRRSLVCGWLRPDGHVGVHVDGHGHLAHRVIWLWMTGMWPIEIDHKDVDGSNNKWENLREATRSQQNANKRVLPTSHTGIKGVGYEPNRPGSKPWRAWAALNGKRKTQRCATLEEARRAQWRLARQLHGEFARRG